MKQFHKTILAIYVLFLLWLILFKTSTDFLSVLADYQSRSLNLIPFAGVLHGSLREMIDNFIVFIPLGLLLGGNFGQMLFWRKLALVFSFSMVAEVVQYALAIGTTDITDVITNTLGGLFGLAVYSAAKKYIDTRKLDAFIAIVIMVLLLAFLFLRLVVFRVRY